MFWDTHMHSNFSGDSDSAPESMILSAIEKNVSGVCFTDHIDDDYPGPTPFHFDPTEYFNALRPLAKQYESQLSVLIGVELGLQPHLAQRYDEFLSAHDFDFAIASSHVVHGFDPYYPEFYAGKTEDEAYLEYFESILENLRCFQDFDVYGHLDYILRYAPRKDEDYSYEKYAELLEEILKTLIQAGKGLDLNTGGIKSGLRDFHPSRAILRRYRELGGEIITVGSDSHGTAGIGAHFASAAEALRECGFRYYSVFENRTPRFLPL